MDNLSFEMLKQGWNAIRMSGAPNLRKIISGLIDPSKILIQRVAEDTATLTVMFNGFDQALSNTETEAPILKRAILAWVKNFAEAQIQRGDPNSFIIRIIKPQQVPTVTETTIMKFGPNISRVSMGGNYFAQIKRAGREWLVEIRKVDTGDLVRYAGSWSRYKDAIEEAKSVLITPEYKITESNAPLIHISNMRNINGK